MENNARLRRNERIQIMYLILTALAVISIIFATVSLIKNAEMIKEDPINYAIEKNKYASCICYDEQGRSYNYAGGDVLWGKTK